MVRVTPIKLQAGTKVLWFDPVEFDVHAGDHVIVQTERGSEFGCATSDIMDVSDELVAQLKSPLKPVIRIADEQDIQRAEELAQKSEDALSTFKELAAETSDQMRPVMVEFLFDGDKAVFYFESEERIDFRDLVRKLASIFHVRVDMRQIGVRDGARMIGGIGHCGQELCCKRLGGGFSPVSIRMAKEQNLSLNPQKISGCCGRLMCCLRYEYEAYKEFNARAPKNGAKIETPEGIAKVTEINVPRERITLTMEDGQTFKVPLEEMERVGDAKRPTRISQEVYEKYAHADPFAIFDVVEMEPTTPYFKGEDALVQPQVHSTRDGDSRSSRKADSGDVTESRNDRSSRRDRDNQSRPAKEDTHRKPRRRRRSSNSGEELTQSDTAKTAATKGGATQPGKKAQASVSSQSATQAHRKPRRRNDGRTDNRIDNQLGESRTDGRSAAHQAARSDNRKSRRRPGQKSSGIRNAPNKGNSQQRPAHQGNSGSGNAPAHAHGTAGEVAHRKPRRRRQKVEGEPHAE